MAAKAYLFYTKKTGISIGWLENFLAREDHPWNLRAYSLAWHDKLQLLRRLLQGGRHERENETN